MSNSSISRRDLLKALGTLPLSVPVANLVQVLLSGVAQRAEAAATGKRYVYIGSAGAPPRWMFDLFLTPYDTSAYIPNGGVGTVGVDPGSGRYTGIRYSVSPVTINGQTLYVPPLWKSLVPTPSGTAPLSSLLENMLSIRGINVGIDGHTAAESLGFQPSGATYTVMGLVGDASVGCPIKALRSGFSNFKFASVSGITPTVASGSGDGKITRLLDPFTSTASSAIKTPKETVRAQLDAAVAALDAFAESQHPGATLLKNSRNDADAMMSRAIAEIRPKWDAVYAKYTTLVKEAMQVSVAGLTDKPVGDTRPPVSEETESVRYKFDDETGLANHSTPLDIRASITATTEVGDLAESFALVEVALLLGLSNSIAISIGNLRNLTVNGMTDVKLVNDQHFTGALVGTLLNTKMWAAVGACTMELVRSLKGAGLFDQTVIHLGAEFNREPAHDLGGTGHGWQANSATIISGMVKAPMVIGNICKADPAGRTSRQGTWGVAAPSINGRTLDSADLANALAKMLGIPQIVKRAASDDIIDLVSGAVVSKIGLGRQV